MIGLSSALAPVVEQQGLQISIGPATLWLNGAVIISPFSFIFLTANATSYVFLNTTTGLLGVNTSGYATVDIPIATIVTNLNRVVTVVDTRPDFTNVGGSGSNILFSDAEVPSGSGQNFTLVNAPDPADSLILTKNGQVLTQQGGSPDYTLSTNAIHLTVALVSGDFLEAWYRY